MDTSVNVEGARAVIKLNGRFDFNAHRDFRLASESVMTRADVREVQLDMAQVAYLDSSALGMLLMLRDKAKAGNKQLALTNCMRNVKQVLEIANFNKLFDIS